MVSDALTEKTVWWANNGKLTPDQFKLLFDDFMAHAKGMTLFAQDLYGGADPKYRIKTRVYCELAWHSLFIRTLLIRPDRGELEDFAPELTIIDLPSFKADPKRHGVRSETIIAIDFSKKIVLIGGSSYAGEMKKSVFTTLNFYLPPQNVVPMHCSANVGDKDDVALFFGLSGTGKTTLSADPNRTLIGDDEHGWSENGVFNFEGGCYAKTINLSAESEPEIYATTRRFGTIFENVILDPDTHIPDFADDSKTENTRAAYPLEFIPNASPTGQRRAPEEHHHAGRRMPSGVMPPIAKLSPAEAMYHFLSGYTAKVAGTEKGLVGVEPPEFSTCFGALFLAASSQRIRQPAARLHRQAQCRLLAGQYRLDRWHSTACRPPHAHQGDPYAAHGRRSTARRKYVDFRTDPYFGFSVPTSVPGVEPHLLNPIKTWKNKAEFDQTARKLVGMFQKNFVKFEEHVDADVRAAAPEVRIAAE